MFQLIQKLIVSTFSQHIKVIDKYAKQGYRFVGYIPIKRLIMENIRS